MKLSQPLFLLLIIFSTQLSAQKNIVKWRPASLAWNSIDFSYERVLSEKTSFAVKAGALIPVDFTNDFNGYKSIFQSSNNMAGGYTMTSGAYGGFSVLPEFRYYTSKDAPNGFYVAPYLKFWRAGISTNVSNDTTHIASGIGGSINVLGGGVGIGYQWLIGDSFTVDWNFMGLGVDAYILNLNVSGVNALGTAGNIQSEFAGAKVTTTSNSASVTSPALFALGFKSNFSIGYMF
ncbi:MAG: DUF3575 domain-containing protein [Bacteroidetes bacterium]|nr:DUF3575 domain-containing protein [Bacteroidota bacterium]